MPTDKVKRIKPDVETCKSSVNARCEALQNALGSIKDAPKELLAACDSAVALAALEIPSLGIFRLGSRNTLFKYADQVLASFKNPKGENGWKYLDWLRGEVKTAAAKEASRRSKKAVLARTKEREKQTSVELLALQVTMTAQSKAYLWLLKEISGIANSQSIESATRQRLLNLINNHDELFGALFGPELTAVRPKNVLEIK